MEEEIKYEFSKHERMAMHALSNFIENAFCGYPGKAGKIENKMGVTVAWLCGEYLDMLTAYAEFRAEEKIKERNRDQL